MKSYFSIQATADRDIAFSKYLVVLGKGMNVFTVLTEDISETIRELLSEGVKIQRVNLLSGTGSFDGLPTGVLFPGEPPGQEAELRQLGASVPEAR